MHIRLFFVVLLIAIEMLVPVREAEASGLEPFGGGSRGRAMGYAMVAVADDWTASFYNPAGLVQISGRTLGAGYELFLGGMNSTESLRNLKLSAGANPMRGDFIVPETLFDEPGMFGEKSVGATINAGEFGYTASWDKFAFGVVLYGSGSGTEWKDSLTAGTDVIDAEISFANVSLSMPLAVAYKTTENFFLGLSLDVKYGVLDVKNSKIRAGVTAPYTMVTEQDTGGVAVGVDIGALWKLTDNLSIGGVFRLPYTFEKSGDTKINNTVYSLNVSSDVTIEESYPLRATFGCAFRPSAINLVAFGVTWLNWSAYNQSVDYATNIPGVFDDSSGNPSNWHDAWVFNLGYERTISDLWMFRCGLAYDQAAEPTDAKTLVGGRVVDSWMFSVGAGRNWGKSTLDFGYTYSYGPEVIGYVPGAKYSLSTHEMYVGYTTKF
jgi:long-chain fatty acid transport protein